MALVFHKDRFQLWLIQDLFVFSLRDDLTSRCAQSQYEFVGVYAESNHLQLPQASILLHYVRPKVVIMNVGSMTWFNWSSDAVLKWAVRVHAFTSGIQHAKLVILCKVLYRTQGMKCSPAIFCQKCRHAEHLFVKHVLCSRVPCHSL